MMNSRDYVLQVENSYEKFKQKLSSQIKSTIDEFRYETDIEIIGFELKYNPAKTEIADIEILVGKRIILTIQNKKEASIVAECFIKHKKQYK